MYSHRNDEYDHWGDEWFTCYEKDKELIKFAKSFGYFTLAEMLDEIEYCSETHDRYTEIYRKFNPVLHKTIDGKYYYSGIYWGLTINTSKKYPPKISKDHIHNEILKQNFTLFDKTLINKQFFKN